MKILSNKLNFFLILLIALAVLMRFYFLDFHPLSSDEMLTLRFFEISHLKNLLAQIKIHDTQQPLYYLLFYNFFHLDINIWLARIPSLIFSLLGIWVHYTNAKKLISKNFALQSTALLSLSFMLLFHSTEIRMYSLLFLLLNCQSFFFHTMINQLNVKKINAIGFLLFGVLATYTHYFGLIYFLSELILLFSIKKHSINKYIRLFLILSTLIVLGFLLPDIFRHFNSYHAYRHQTTLLDFLGVIAYLFSGKFFVIALFIFALTCKCPKVQFVNFIKKHWDLIFITLFPIIFIFLKSRLSAPAFEARYFIGSLSPFYLLVTLYCHETKWRTPKQNNLFLFILITASLYNIISKEHYFQYPYRLDTRGISQEIINEQKKIPFLNIVSCNTCPTFYLKGININCIYSDENYTKKIAEGFNFQKPTLFIENNYPSRQCDNVKNLFPMKDFKLNKQMKWTNFYTNY